MATHTHEKGDPLSGLREQLSRADRVLGFARKLKHDSGAVPPGVSQDFAQARAGLEKEFVLAHDRVPPKARDRLKEFLLRTRNLDNAGVEKNLEKLSRRARSLLNELVILGGGATLTEESFADDLLTSPPSRREPAGRSVDMAAPAAPGRDLRAVWIALAVVGALAVVALVIVLSGALAPARLPNLVANNIPDEKKPRDNTVRDGRPKDGVRPSPFDAQGAGYGVRLAVQPLTLLVEPLELDPSILIPADLPALQMGLEHMIELAEPERLRMTPDETRRAMQAFAGEIVENEAGWKQARKPLLEALVGHAQARLQFTVYPRGEQLLVSDFLADKGAPRNPALMALAALGRTAGCPLEVVAPTTPEFTMLAVQLPTGTATFDGDGFAQRPLLEPALPLTRLFASQLEALRPSLKTAGARCVVSAALLRCNGVLTLAQARDALADLSEDFFAPLPGDGKPETRRAKLFAAAARVLLKEVAPILLGAQGGAAESLRVYRLAAAAKEENIANLALVEVGKRAAKGALLDGEPVLLVVGELVLRMRNDREAATGYFRRVFEEFADDPRPALRLADLAADDVERLGLLREAYTRGERGLEFLRSLAELLYRGGEALAALAMLDELCEQPDCSIEDVLALAKTCVGLDRPDWAQERLARAARFKDEPALQRLDLILELSLNGASERARRLARLYVARDSDPFVADLLKRFGME